MGKSEFEVLRPSDLNLRIENRANMKPWRGPKPNESERKSISNSPTPIVLPRNMELLSNQVAGHMHDGKHIGMIKHMQKVLKPILKPACGEREISLYEELNRSDDPIMLELKKLAPKYHGTQVLTLGDRQIECIVLDDVTSDIKEPCIMDVKIGRRTYDPLASYEKIINENQKYHETKRDLGFCIPGFQIYKLSNEKFVKYGKDYGKNLNKDTVKEALKTFLNSSSGLNRSLLLQLLASLWCIQNWARKQRKLRLYSSSLLLMYDARKLRQNLQTKHKPNEKPIKLENPRTLKRSTSLYRPISYATLNNVDNKTGFSGQLTKEGPILQKSSSPTRIPEYSPRPERKVPSLKRMHSFNNNYDKDLQNMKRDYTFLLDQLVSDCKHQAWASVKIIDFAHVFPAESNELDNNFLEGVENLIKIFEDFIPEAN